MKKHKKWLAILLSFVFALACIGCDDSATDIPPADGDEKDPPAQEIMYDDNRTVNNYEFALSQIAGTDALGRSIYAGDASQEKREVGLFYFLWLGQHPSEQKAVYDVSVFEQQCPDEILNPESTVSPVNQYHHWGEPLYGYYNSEDPWVLTRHVELFTTAGIDFLMFDTTNAEIYENVVARLLRILDTFRKQGFAVPKVAFMTNTRPRDTAANIYNRFYAANAPYRYPDLWYCPNGKPLIISDADMFSQNNATDKAMLDLFEIRAAQWPDDPVNYNKFPWISFAPQRNHNGVMSVSVAQHIKTYRMSDKEKNRGKGFSRTDNVNDTLRAATGSNFQEQWDNVFAANASANVADVDTVFVTGWNEWIALKLKRNEDVFFVDNYNTEYSRDLEMDKTAYGDNFYMQLVNNVHRLKFGDIKHYKHTAVTADGADSEAWANVRAYPDFVGDALARNYRGYAETTTYTDNTNRNDLKEIKVASDDTYAYFRIECASAISDYVQGDKTYMNVWLTAKRTTGYEYVINRTYGKLSKINADGTYSDVADVAVAKEGNVLTVKVALADIGVNAQDPGFLFKVSDSVDASDPMNFYIQGDSAPIGRLSYTFGYVK